MELLDVFVANVDTDEAPEGTAVVEDVGLEAFMGADERGDEALNVGGVGFEDAKAAGELAERGGNCLLYTSPSPRDLSTSRMPSSA